jgi:phosphate:Na+ symporter
MTDADHRRVEQVLAFATNLEHAGDVVDKSLTALASKRLKRGLAFSKEGQADLVAMMERLLTNLRTAASMFMTEDPRAARLLASEKQAFRDMEAAATQAHFARLQEGRIETAATSSLHLDVVRDLKRGVVAGTRPRKETVGSGVPWRRRMVTGLASRIMRLSTWTARATSAC